MGQETKKKLQLLAAQWNTQWSNNASKFGLGTKDASATNGSGVAGSNETRGLLDDDDGDEMELSFAGVNAPGKKIQ